MGNTITSSEVQSGLKHPIGLWILVFTETWERLSHYGMRAILTLYMVAPLAMGGLGLSKATAGTLYGFYLLGLYSFALPGGWMADHFLGRRKAIIFGGAMIALGQFALMVSSLGMLIAGLSLIAVGTGLAKPNISTTVGRLYRKDDPRRDGAFSIEYSGINLGATIAPIVCGYMAENPKFLELLKSIGLSSKSGWSWAFSVAGIGMIIGLIQYVLNSHKIIEVPTEGTKTAADGTVEHPSLTPEDYKRMGVIGILFLFSATFWALFQQAGSSLNIFAKEFTQETIAGFTVPASWYQVINPLFIITLGPVFAWLWTKLGDRFSSPSKFATGLLLVGGGFLLLVPASWAVQADPSQITRVSPLWLTGLYFLHTLGELCFSPVGMSLTSKLAPARFSGLMMGVWFASIGAGSFVSGAATGLMDKLPLAKLFGIFGWIAIGAAVLLWLIKGFILKLMAAK